MQILFGCDGRLPEIARILNQASADKLPNLPIRHAEWRDNIQRKLDTNARQQELQAPGNKIEQLTFCVDDFVLLRRDTVKPKKLESDWTGPFRIVAEVSPSRYQLRRVMDTAESSRLTSAAASQLRLWSKCWTPEECQFLLSDFEQVIVV